MFGHWKVTMDVMTLKDYMYVPSGSDDPDWSNEDTIAPSPNAMESSMLSIFKVSK
jgi:hypothetical protein